MKKNVVKKNVFVSSENSLQNLELKIHRGTANLTSNPEHLERFITLDNVFEKEKLKECHLIKIDTDGYDLDVILGAKNIISTYLPAILFEFDCNFEKKGYEMSLKEVIVFLIGCGYKEIIFYDNFGFLFDVAKIDNEDSWYYKLQYMKSKRFYFFDVLILPPSKSNHIVNKEKQFFKNYIKRKE